MNNDDIIKYYDYLMGIAVSKCDIMSDAEDLVNDTVLAALSFIRGGGKIEYPKTWLSNTLYHKLNDNLRKKYRSPITVCLENSTEVPQEENDGIITSEEAAAVRKELNHLERITREVMIRYYYSNQSVADIATDLGIPEGTVKRRLSDGRNKVKKGFETMEVKENCVPGKLYLTFGGSDGLKGEPISLVEDDLIAQNLLILAYEKPVTVSELSKAIGIPAAYIEPVINKLVDGELMVRTDSGKIYSDFIIQNPRDKVTFFKPQLEFAHCHFNTVWNIMRKMSAEISALGFVKELGRKEQIKLDRYAVLKALQDFTHYGTGKISMPEYPLRRDGGRWIAQGTAFEAGYDDREFLDSMEYAIQGGHRTTEAHISQDSVRVRFYEFDTTLYDSPCRYGGSVESYELYFKHVIPLLWSIFKGRPPEETEIPNEFISRIPVFETLGLLWRKDGIACVNVPVLKKTEYREICRIISSATESLKTELGAEFDAFISKMKTPVPKHLMSVPELFRYGNATTYFVMAIVREAHSRGLHMKDVDYCCPPVLLVYEEE